MQNTWNKLIKNLYTLSSIVFKKFSILENNTAAWWGLAIPSALFSPTHPHPHTHSHTRTYTVKLLKFIEHKLIKNKLNCNVFPLLKPGKSRSYSFDAMHSPKLLFIVIEKLLFETTENP